MSACSRFRISRLIRRRLCTARQSGTDVRFPVASREFNEKAPHGIARNECQNKCAALAFTAAQVNQKKKCAQPKQRFIKLRGMKPNAERRTRKLRGKWVREHHSPR